MHCGHAGVVEIVATNSDADTIYFFFLRTEGGNEAAIGEFLVAWNCQQRD